MAVVFVMRAPDRWQAAQLHNTPRCVSVDNAHLVQAVLLRYIEGCGLVSNEMTQIGR
jgi:hypothetical protein